jgi:hypothetical protein
MRLLIVTASSTTFLIEVLDGFTQRMMNDKANVGFIDAHSYAQKCLVRGVEHRRRELTKGNRRTDHVDLISQPAFVHLGPSNTRQTSMITTGFDA